MCDNSSTEEEEGQNGSWIIEYPYAKNEPRPLLYTQKVTKGILDLNIRAKTKLLEENVGELFMPLG